MEGNSDGSNGSVELQDLNGFLGQDDPHGIMVLDVTRFMPHKPAWWIRTGPVFLCWKCYQGESQLIRIICNLPLGLLAAFLLFLYFVSQTFIDEVFLRPERKDEPRKIGAFLALLLLLDWAIHFWTMLSNRFDSSFLLARRNHLHQENVGFWQTLMCLGLAFLLSTFNIFPIFHLLVPSKDFPILMGIWFLRFMGFPFFLQPFLGTILLLDLEIRELSNRLKDVAASNDLQLTRTFVQEVVGVKSKWARFLQAQLALGLLQPLAYTFTVFLTATRPELNAQWLLFYLVDAPVQLTSVCLQVSHLAKFNQRLFDWRLETEHDSVYRLLHQKEQELNFSIFGYTITFAKLRFSILSFLLSMACNQVPKLLEKVEDFFAEA